MDEIQTKQNRLSQFLDRHHLDGVILWQRNNFAWITGGCDNHVVNATPVGFAAIYATRDSRTCLTTTIEAPRFRQEELVGRGIDVVDFPWWDRAASQKIVRDLIGSKKVATDSDELGMGLPSLPGDFAELRWSLLPDEIARYRDGAKRAAMAMEKACRQLKPGMTEFEAAGLLDHCIRDIGGKPTVNLIAADERAQKFRHAIPTATKIKKHVMLVICSDVAGLIANLTRWVHFGPLSDELKKKQQAIANIDTAANLLTRPGRTLGEIFKDIQAAYARENWPDQWKLHHQGGSTGYAGREVVATPDSAVKVVDNQAFAWNPSIVGAKCEDTVLLTNGRHEVLTAHSKDWPAITGRFNDETLARADILVL
ncbi:MAG TPA: M24 family metallopeptidase [Tepidisphaeraceae bacterium]|nr:M24 family metallopeptidase [Tepidisphaeraceae bacterium]